MPRRGLFPARLFSASDIQMKNTTLLRLDNITKTYPGVVALDDVSLSFEPGTVHAIVGENGAGKSTLIKVITGAIAADSGAIEFLGKRLVHHNPVRSIEAGISAIYQEFNLFPHLSVAENVFANQYRTRAGLIDFGSLETRCREVMDRLGVEIDPRTLVKDLSVGYQQLVEIAKSLVKDVKLLIMDEPSAAMTDSELERVFAIVRRLRDEGVTILYISHRLDEIFDLCDTVSVFRDGRHVQTMPVAETDRSELIRLMVNRPLTDTFPHLDHTIGETVLEVRNVSTNLLNDVSFSVRRGERLGLAGLVGAGRTEVARVLFGADRPRSGQVLLRGVPISVRRPIDAIRHGIALVPEDRKQHGVMLHMSVEDNVTAVRLPDYADPVLGYIRQSMVSKAVNRYVDELRIKTPSPTQLVRNLSGGNQQKVVLAKWLLMDCEVIIFDEPTRGIDVGAKQEIYGLINDLAEAGKTIIMISSELPELLGMTDRIVVMADGSVTAEIETTEATQERIMALSAL
jgi:ribose transport system ATP-binding protein